VNRKRRERHEDVKEGGNRTKLQKVSAKLTKMALASQKQTGAGGAG